MIALALDTETTGLVLNHIRKLDKQPHVTEFYGAMFNMETGEILEEIDTLVKPPIPIPPEVVKKVKITDEMVKDSPVFLSIAAPIGMLIERAPLVIAHNASFDRAMLDIEFERLGMTIQWPPLLCTVEATLHLKGYRLNLTALHSLLFAEPFPEAHRAKHDVAALIRCCVELKKRGEI